jgi:hypothetical protein
MKAILFLLVFPLLGIANQLQEPVLVKKTDFAEGFSISFTSNRLIPIEKFERLKSRLMASYPFITELTLDAEDLSCFISFNKKDVTNDELSEIIGNFEVFSFQIIKD